MGWFTSSETYEVEVRDPADMESTAKVTLRPLTAADQADINDTMAMVAGVDDAPHLKVGTMKMLSVQKAVVSWDFGKDAPPVSPGAIANLHPYVFEQIFSEVRIGGVPAKEEAEVPPTAATAEPTPA